MYVGKSKDIETDNLVSKSLIIQTVTGLFEGNSSSCKDANVNKKSGHRMIDCAINSMMHLKLIKGAEILMTHPISHHPLLIEFRLIEPPEC